MSSLQEHLAETYDVTEQLEAVASEEEVSERFIVDDQDKASWAMRKLAQIKARQSANTEQATAERERIRAWEEEENGILESHAAFFESLLIDYHRSELEADPKRKTIRLPSGVLASRKRALRVEVDDTQAFIEWAAVARPEFVRTKLEVDKKAVNEAAAKDGEVLPHVTVEDLGPSFTVTPH